MDMFFSCPPQFLESLAATAPYHQNLNIAVGTYFIKGVLAGA